MNLYDAYVILLDATVEKDDDRQIRNARKRIAKKVEVLRLKREAEANRKKVFEQSAAFYSFPGVIHTLDQN